MSLFSPEDLSLPMDWGNHEILGKIPLKLFPNVTFGYMVILITFTGLIKLQEDQRKLCKQL